MTDAVDSLSKEGEITITFHKRDGKERTIPIWFALEGSKVQMLPMYGSKTKWFLDVEKAGRMEIRAGGFSRIASPKVVRDANDIEEIKARFAKKYGEAEVQRYYAKQDVAVEAAL